MTGANLVRMAWRDLVAMRARAVISGAGVSLGVAVLLVIVGLGLGAREVVLSEVMGSLPVNTLQVVPRTVNLGLFEVDTDALFGATPLNAETLDKLRRLPGVAAAYPCLEIKLPMGARGGSRLFGRNLYTDLFMTGLPEPLVAGEVGSGFQDQGDMVPVVISNQLIEIYNASVAPSLGTPRLTADTLKGFEFEIVFGRSLMLGQRGARRTGVERARIVGASRHAMRLGASVPLSTARRLRDKYGSGDGEEEKYLSILLRAESPSEVPQIAAAIKAAGLSLDETAERTGNILAVVTLLFSLVGVLVLTLAALNIAHSFFASLRERRRELAILRAVGAGKSDLVRLALGQAVILGLTGGAVGVGLAIVATWGLDFAARVFLPSFPFKPDSFFLLPPWLLGAALLAAVLAAGLGALWPAWRASRAPLAQALNDL